MTEALILATVALAVLVLTAMMLVPAGIAESRWRARNERAKRASHLAAMFGVSESILGLGAVAWRASQSLDEFRRHWEALDHATPVSLLEEGMRIELVEEGRL